MDPTGAPRNSRIHSRGELYEKSVQPVSGSKEPLLKHHLALLFAWAEERAIEVSQKRFGGAVTSLRAQVETDIDAYHDEWYTRVEALAARLEEGVDREERERVVVATRNDAERAEKAFYALCEAAFSGKDDAEEAANLSDAMANLGDDLAFLTNSAASGGVQAHFRALAALVHATVKARAEGIGSKDGGPMRKYLSLHQTVLNSAGGLEAQ